MCVLACHTSTELTWPVQNRPRTRKRVREEHSSTESPRKRFQPPAADLDESSYIEHWVEKNNTWPRQGFQTRLIVQPGNMDVLAKRKSPSLRRKRSESSIGDSVTSDQKTREATYTHRNYPTWLEGKGVCMERSGVGISDESKKLYLSLLKTKCSIPKDTIFRDDILEDSIEEIQDKNESRIIQDIARLLVPSVGALAKISDKHLGVLIESVNEGWDNCFPLTEPRPQPDFAVGFRRSAFGDDRIRKLRPLVGDEPSLHRSCLMGTHYMYFPVLTSEVKSGTAGLDIADRQNAHSMGIAVRAIVLIFQLARKHIKLHRKLLTFSISHDHQTVRLHGWYPVINGDSYRIYRHLIHSFNIVAMEGQEKWTTRRFVIGVYEYALTLLEKINAVIDELPPDLNLGSLQPMLQLLGPRSQKSGLSQLLEDKAQTSEHSGLSQRFEDQSLDAEPIIADSQQITPDTSIQPESVDPKKKKKTK